MRSDFSLAVVAANSHVDKPLIYRIAGTWGNHEGSMLLWSLVSGAFGAVLASSRGSQEERLWTRAVGVQGLVTCSYQAQAGIPTDSIYLSVTMPYQPITGFPAYIYS